MRVICLDTETTGLDVSTDQVIELCIAVVDTPVHLRTWRFKPSVRIAEDATAAHGIRIEDLVDCPPFRQEAPTIATHIESADVVTGYNPNFDLDILKEEFKRIGYPVKWPTIVVCCKRLWDINDPPPPRHLQAAYARFVSPEGFPNAHSAEADVRATIEVLMKQREEFKLTDKPWAELDPERMKWVGSSQHLMWENNHIVINFGKHKGKKLADVDGGYLRYIIEKDFPPHLKQLCSQLQTLHKTKTPNADELIARWAKENLK